MWYIQENTFKVVWLNVYFFSSGGCPPDPHVRYIDSCEEFHLNYASP